jgi:hypothetical protein
MLAGVWFGFGINSYIIDAIIGFSVVYKALDNLGAFRIWFGVQPDTKVATLIFGFLHGFGLASKIIDYEISPDGSCRTSSPSTSASRSASSWRWRCILVW